MYSKPLPFPSCLSMMMVSAAFLLLLTGRQTAEAATIGTGDVTAALGPSFFVDDAVTGGSDVTITEPAVPGYNRSFAGLLTTNQGPARVTLTGFGFATSTSSGNNTASSLTLTFTYLGADEAVGGGDDVAMGSAVGTYAYSGAGEYVFAFDTPITADLNITGTRFRIQVAPANGTNNGKVLFKTAALTYETATGPKFSVSGIVSPQRVNLAKFQPVTTDSVNGQQLASYVTDGNGGNENRWQSSGSGPHWARVDFPFPVEIGSAQVFTGFDDTLAQANFKIQYLDGASWVDAPGAVVTGNTDVESNIVFTSPVTANSFRLHSTDGTLRIRELALYPPNGGSGFTLGTDVRLNLAQQRPAVASANTAGNFALLAVDGRVNKDSMWQTSTAGTNTLDIDLIVSTKIGSAHLFSGSPGVAPLEEFDLKYWDGSAWQNIDGGSVTGNTISDLVVSFTTPVITSMVRLEFSNPGTTSVRELCIFATNEGNTGYPLGTGVTGVPPSTANVDDYTDSFYQINNAGAGRFIAVGNSGQPALDEPGLTTGQGQYQILLNISTGTYRLRNRATGNCLSGDQLSKTVGLPLTDTPYSALPHQDWILDPLDGGEFQLINQWSGLAIDTQGGGSAAGTPLVQNTANGSASQRWQVVFSLGFPKKGVGGNNYAQPFNANWMYNWGLNSSATLPPGAVFQPMQWGNYNWTYNTTANSTWKLYPTWRASSQSLHLMGFNEPDKFDQSGNSLDTENTNEADFSATRSMEKAVELWPRLMAMDLPLVSPAPASMTNGWLADFYTQANARGYRVDYTAIHTYPGPNGGSSNNLVSTIQSAYSTWGRPVWLTEFSFVDWSKNSSWSEEDCYNCLAEFLWRAESESLSWFRKYALFVFTEDANNPQPANPWSTSVTTGGAPRSNSRDINGNLTAFGKLYAEWDNDATVRTDKTYYIHNKSTRKRLANLLASGPNAKSIRVDDNSVKWTLVSTGVANRYYLVSSSDGRRLGYTSGSPTLAASDTTGTAVEWSLTENQYGWYYLNHPFTNTRLSLSYNNTTSTATYTMAAGTSTTDNVKWRFIVPPPPPSWSGASDSSWITAGNWTSGSVPPTGDEVSFDHSSTANLDTVLDQDFDLSGISLADPAGPVSIGGTNALTLGAGGLDLTAATQDLTISAPLVLSADQSWNVSSGRTLEIGGAVSGNSDITIAGAGKVLLAAGNLLPNGAGAGNLIVNGTLDLNGTSQSINGLSGNGVIGNTTAGTSILTVGNNDADVTLDAVLQNTNGTLFLVKTGAAGLVLNGANTFDGGFTNNGSGSVYPKTDTAFGTGPVVMNGSTLYATGGNYTFANALTLNNSTLRVGGGTGKSIAWTGPVTATGTSGLICDGGTAGITLGSTLDITGATFTSSANGTTNNFDGIISGASGNFSAVVGTHQFAGANTYTGTTTISAAGVFRLQPTGTISSSSNVVINTGGNFNVRNTVGWVYTGTITGDGTGVINLNSLTDAELAGPISGVPAITANNSGTNTTVSGAISGAVNVTATGGAILTLAGDNTALSGTITINGTTAGTQLNLGSATALGTGELTISGGTGKIDNSSGSALTLSTNNAQAWSQNISFVGTNALNLGTGAVTMGGNRTLNVTNTLTVGGNISDGGSGYGITKNGWGNLVLTGTSTYSGATVIAQSTLSVGSIKDYGVASAIGAPLSGNIQLGNANDFCNLIYTGSGDSTNRTVQLGNTNPANTGVGSIKNNGTGALTFTAANFNPTIAGITAGRLLWLGGDYTGGNNEIQGIIQDNDASGAVGVGKGNDDSIWVLSGANTYTGSTIVQGGALKLGASGSIASSSQVSFNAGATFDTSAQAIYTIPGGQTLTFGIDAAGSGSCGKIAAAGLDITSAVVTYNIAGTPDDPVYVLATYTGLTGTFASVDAPPAGYTLNYAYEGNKIALVEGVLGGYSAWQAANSTVGGLDADHDTDGVSNGVEYFLGGATNTTGFTELPGVTNTAGTLSVTWIKDDSYAGEYNTHFFVETSDTLISWMIADEGTGEGFVEITGNEVKYTFPSGTKNFARLKVTGP